MLFLKIVGLCFLYFQLGKLYYKGSTWVWDTASERSKLLQFYFFPISTLSGVTGKNDRGNHWIRLNTCYSKIDEHNVKILLEWFYACTGLWPLFILWFLGNGILHLVLTILSFLYKIFTLDFAVFGRAWSMVSKAAVRLVDKKDPYLVLAAQKEKLLAKVKVIDEQLASMSKSTDKFPYRS